MIVKKLSATLVLSFLALAASTGYAGPQASVNDLGWMTGHWVGAAGPNTLEENWILPEGGSLAAIVRMTGDGGTSMFEVIAIEEKDGSLVLSIQQWDAGFVPRAEAQKMELVEISENKVTFKAVSEGGMAMLGYSSPTPTTFNIDIETTTGAKFQLNLKAR